MELGSSRSASFLFFNSGSGSSSKNHQTWFQLTPGSSFFYLSPCPPEISVPVPQINGIGNLVSCMVCLKYKFYMPLLELVPKIRSDSNLGFNKQLMKPMALTLQTRYSLSTGFNQYLIRNKFTRYTYVCIQQM
jgi:hypothetical protein